MYKPNPQPQPTKPAEEDIETMRRRMVRELEEFLTRAIDDSFPGLLQKATPRRLPGAVALT